MIVRLRKSQLEKLKELHAALANDDEGKLMLRWHSAGDIKKWRRAVGTVIGLAQNKTTKTNERHHRE